MGWSGYGLYDGDGTSSNIYNFIKWATGLSDDEAYDACDEYGLGSMKVSKEHQFAFLDNLPKVLKKMPKSKYFDEDTALEWQMLGAFFVDNKLPIPHVVRTKVLYANEYLMGDHAADFDRPSQRRATLNRFKKRVKALEGLLKNGSKYWTEPFKK